MQVSESTVEYEKEDLGHQGRISHLVDIEGMYFLSLRCRSIQRLAQSSDTFLAFGPNRATLVPLSP